jgi:tellurite resistance protein TehA-like permease
MAFRWLEHGYKLPCRSASGHMQALLSWLAPEYISSSGQPSECTCNNDYAPLTSSRTFPIHTMTPIWIFPAYPLLLLAPFASNLIDAVPDSAAASRINSIAIMFGAICIQGTGFLVSLMIYSAFIYRLMTQKLPRETTRPGMVRRPSQCTDFLTSQFVSVGPSGFTVAGIVHLGNIVLKIIPDGYGGEPKAAFFFKLISDLTGLWLWGLCLWFFIVSVGAHWQLMKINDAKHHIEYDMTWLVFFAFSLLGTNSTRFSFVFPNTALVTATQAIGKAFDSKAIKIFGTVLACIVILVWMVVFGTMIRAIWLRRLLWPRTVRLFDRSDIAAKM